MNKELCRRNEARTYAAAPAQPETAAFRRCNNSFKKDFGAMLLTKIKMAMGLVLVAGTFSFCRWQLINGLAAEAPIKLGERVEGPANTPGKLSKADLNRIQGTWLQIGQEVDGKKARIDHQPEQDRLWVVWGDNLTSGNRRLDFKCKLDASKSPKMIDLKRFAENQTFLGIYEINNDILKICIRDGEEELRLGEISRHEDRPSKFETKDGHSSL